MTGNYKIFLSAFIVLLCTSIGLHFLAGYSQDKLWLLLAAHKWLDGKKLYVDVFEVNPPLIIWLDAIPVYLSMHLGTLSDAHFSILIGLMATAGVISVCLTLIKQHPGFTECKTRWEFCLLLICVFITFENPFYFFEREHIFQLLIFPYILRFMPSLAKAATPAYLRIIIGIMAGIGFCIKPHCFMVFAGLQILYFLRERSFAILTSSENILIYLIACAYLAAIFLLTPEYITTVLPMALATYSVIRKTMAGMVYLELGLFYLAMAFIDFRRHDKSPYRRDIFYLLATCPFFILYSIANNGWGYTWTPFCAMTITVTGWVLLERIYLKKTQTEKGLPVKPYIQGIRACMIVFGINAAIVVLYVALLAGSCGNYFSCENGKKFIQEAEEANGGKPVTTFGTISMAFPVWTLFSRQTNANWETRFNQLWMLPKFFISDAVFTKHNKWILDYVGNAYAEDLKNNKPQLVFVDDTDDFYMVQKYEDLLAFLKSSPAFAREWQHYGYVYKMDGLDEIRNKKKHHGYYVYKRID